MTPQALLETAKLKWAFAHRTYDAKNNPDNFEIYVKGFTDGYRLAEDLASRKIEDREAKITRLLERIEELKIVKGEN